MSLLIVPMVNLEWATKLEKLGHGCTSDLAHLAQSWGFNYHDSWALADWAVALR